ncbi:hypothetical protein HK405_004171 [Cladochytrium tenue]|nr:hypothetical protein HK405_004171 [Cladochytrium tenue]
MSIFFTSDQLVAVRALSRVSAGVSLLGNLAVVSTYVLYERYRTSVNKLVFYYTLADMIFSVMCLIGETPFSPTLNQHFCDAQGILIVFSNMATVLWSCCMSLQCVLAVTQRTNVRNLQRYHLFYHIVVWGASIIMTAVVANLQAIYGNGIAFSDTIVYCWINQNYRNWKLYAFYVPLWISMFFNIALYGVVIWKLREMNAQKTSSLEGSYAPYGQNSVSAEDRQQAKKEQHRLNHAINIFVYRTSIYVAIYFINWFMPSVNRIYNFINPIPVMGIYVFVALFVPIGGLLNAIAYFYFAHLTAVGEGKSSGNAASNPDLTNPPGVYYGAGGAGAVADGLKPSFVSAAPGSMYPPTQQQQPGGYLQQPQQAVYGGYGQLSAASGVQGGAWATPAQMGQMGGGGGFYSGSAVGSDALYGGGVTATTPAMGTTTMGAGPIGYGGNQQQQQQQQQPPQQSQWFQGGAQQPVQQQLGGYGGYAQQPPQQQAAPSAYGAGTGGYWGGDNTGKPMYGRGY